MTRIPGLSRSCVIPTAGEGPGIPALGSRESYAPTPGQTLRYFLIGKAGAGGKRDWEVRRGGRWVEGVRRGGGVMNEGRCEGRGWEGEGEGGVRRMEGGLGGEMAE